MAIKAELQELLLFWSGFVVRQVDVPFLSKRISCHAQEGNIFNHYNNVHNCRPSRATLVDAIEIIDYEADPRRLRLLEALHISSIKPSINVTQEPMLLPSSDART